MLLTVLSLTACFAVRLVASAEAPPSDWVATITPQLKSNNLDPELLKGDNARWLSTPCLSHDGSMTPLMFCAKDGCRPKTVKLLLEAGAEVATLHNTGTTAIMFAAREGSRETLKVLVDAAATAGIVESQLAAVDEHGNNALLLGALQSSCPSCARVLLDATNARDWALAKNVNGNTALQVSAFYSVSDHFLKELLKDETIRQHVDEGADGNGRTALMLACSANSPDNVIALLKAGADPTLTSGGTTALALAGEKNPQLLPLLRGKVGEL